MENVLLLASSSTSRQQLLKEVCIPFSVVPQTADELSPSCGMPLEQLVTCIARMKMDHVIMPAGTGGEERFVLTADTLTHYASGVVAGKPSNKEQAIRQIQEARAGQITTGTAFCLEKRRYELNEGVNSWQCIGQAVRFVSAQYQFYIPDMWLDRYFELSNGYYGSGAIAVEGFGSLFLKELCGSYSTIVGLPLYELREELDLMGFF